jgi:hypothetical protein
MKTWIAAFAACLMSLSATAHAGEGTDKGGTCEKCEKGQCECEKGTCTCEKCDCPKCHKHQHPEKK